MDGFGGSRGFRARITDRGFPKQRSGILMPQPLHCSDSVASTQTCGLSSSETTTEVSANLTNLFGGPFISSSSSVVGLLRIRAISSLQTVWVVTVLRCCVVLVLEFRWFMISYGRSYWGSKRWMDEIQFWVEQTWTKRKAKGFSWLGRNPDWEGVGKRQRGKWA